MDDLKQLTPTHDGIVFDDMSFNHWPAEACIHLVDLAYNRSINVRYGTVMIPAELPRIFTTNVELTQFFSEKTTEEQWLAIERRIEKLYVIGNLF